MREFQSVHDAHCCVIHGCKYGDPGCPVSIGEELGIECEECFNDREQEAYKLIKERQRYTLLEEIRDYFYLNNLEKDEKGSDLIKSIEFHLNK